jgi:hypothetical protein
MKRPDTWVISLELDDSVRWDWWSGSRDSSFFEDLRVATSWVLWVRDDTVPGS